MTQQFNIRKKGSRKLKFLYITFFAGAIFFCVLAVAAMKFLMFIPAFLLFFFAVRTYTSSKRILGQKIEIDDNSVTYYMGTGECTTLIFSEITVAGFYAKNPIKLKSGKGSIGEGLYLYSEKIDRYCLIGTDFDRSDELYNILKAKCDAVGAKWQDLSYCGKFGLVKKLKELLNINEDDDDSESESDSECESDSDSERESEKLQETNAE